MVAHLTAGSARYRDNEPLMQEILSEIKRLQSEMVRLIDADTEAFNKVAAVFRMPGGTEEEKNRKKEAG